MTDLIHFSMFFAAALLLAITPGPGIFYVAARTLAGGRAEGIASSLGTGLGGMVHVVAGALGVEISRLSLSPVAIALEGSAPGIQALEGLAERLRGQGWVVQSDTPGLTPEGRPRFLLKGTAAHEG